jgi:hypothetical protein
MTWTYSGDPSVSEKDKYRFLIDDTDENNPLLQDEEIQFVLNSTNSHYGRLAVLYRICSNKFSKDPKKSLGPQSIDPTSRAEKYERLADRYEKLASAVGAFSNTSMTDPVFTKEMHDNV